MVLPSERICMTMWLPRCLTITKPCCASIAHTSCPDKTRSLPNGHLDLSNKYVHHQSSLDFFRRCAFKK